MIPLFYMLSLKICGIKNIEKPVEFEFYKKTINNDFDPEKYRIKAIYGENGSGKTAIIQAVKILTNLMKDKDYLKDRDTQKKLALIINKKNKEGFVETEFYIDFGKEKSIFKYFVSFMVKEDSRVYIIQEKLEKKNGKYSKNNYEVWYKTDGGNLVDYVKWNSNIFSFLKEKTQNLLNKQTLIASLMDIEDMPEAMKESDERFLLLTPLIFAITLFVSIDVEDSHDSYVLRERINELESSGLPKNENDFINIIKNNLLKNEMDDKFVSKKIMPEYKQRIDRLCDFIKIFKPELERIDIEKQDADDYYKCNLTMVYKDYTLDKEFESRGIKKLMDLFTYLDAASMGGIVFIDELDSNISDVYLDKLIEYFVYFGKGQLIFTAHNLSPMTVLRKNKNSINFISSINTVHTWTKNGNLTPENAYKAGFIEDSPFNVDASDFLGILGGVDE